MESINTLVIENLTLTPEYGEHTSKFVCELNTKIQFRCPVNKDVFMEIIMTSKGDGLSDESALNRAIQNFLNKKTRSENRLYDVQVNCEIPNKIHSVDIQVQEPYRSLFRQLFDMSKREIPTKELIRG